jgi:hypothetical protein
MSKSLVLERLKQNGRKGETNSIGKAFLGKGSLGEQYLLLPGTINNKMKPFSSTVKTSSFNKEIQLPSDEVRQVSYELIFTVKYYVVGENLPRTRSISKTLKVTFDGV